MPIKKRKQNYATFDHQITHICPYLPKQVVFVRTNRHVNVVKFSEVKNNKKKAG